MHALTASISEPRRERLIVGFTALAVAIHLLEAALPSPLPGVKPGLANVIVLIALLRYDWPLAAAIGLLRPVTGSLINGTFLTPTFVMSFSGALGSLMILGLAWLLARRVLSPIGFGALAALGHMSGQVLAAYSLFIPHPAVLKLLPVLLAASLGLGILSGIICRELLRRLPPRPC